MINISIHVTGNKEAQQKIAKLGAKFMMFDIAMADIGEKLTDYYANQAFLSQGGVFDAKWPRLMQKTTLYKSRHYSGRPPEVRTGNMQKGFKYTATARNVRIYNRMPYFAYQDLGTRTLPAREMIGVNRPVMEMIKVIIEKDINKKLSTA